MGWISTQLFGFVRFDESEFCLELAKSSIQMKTDLKVQKLATENILALLVR
ncbi:hypothetical protein [Planococcus kocurii]|uniref:hypothetical protein n=1 Tax=Planococcus kocurii TaxID=1374 RepID=UPI000A42A99A|nr:hypothetical protein [Planococcus kocurii]